MKNFCGFFFFTLLLINANLFSLERDLDSPFGDCVGQYCPYCIKPWSSEVYPQCKEFIGLIPRIKKQCDSCSKHNDSRFRAIYGAYISNEFTKYFELFHDYLIYCQNNKPCECYWPETSSRAAKISDKAYALFGTLFTKTALSVFMENLEEQTQFLLCSPLAFNMRYDRCFNRHHIIVSVISKAFFYSHFVTICEDLDAYSKSRFSKEEYEIIRKHLEDILTTMKPVFAEMYQSCLEKHRNTRIEIELENLGLEKQKMVPRMTSVN